MRCLPPLPWWLCYTRLWNFRVNCACGATTNDFAPKWIFWTAAPTRP